MVLVSAMPVTRELLAILHCVLAPAGVTAYVVMDHVSVTMAMVDMIVGIVSLIRLVTVGILVGIC